MGFFDDLIPSGSAEIPPEGRTLLKTIAGSESRGYNMLYGGGTFDKFDDHPRRAIPIQSGPNVGRTTSAAGLYQFLAPTWDEVKKEANLPDFSEKSQDLGAWHLAQRDYKRKTGRELLPDLQAAQGNQELLNKVGGALSGTWTSLPGGIEPNRATSSFASRYTAAGAPTDFSSQSRKSIGLFDDLIPKAREPEAPVDPMAAALDTLAAGLRRGENNNQEIYKTAAFRSNAGLPPAGATDLASNAVLGGFGDEITAAARAPIDMATRGEGFDEAYQHNLAANRDRLDQYRKANPKTAIASEIAGGLAFPVGKSPVKSGIATGAIFGAGNSEGDVAQKASDAALSGALGGAVGAVASGISRAFGSKAPDAAPSIGELRAAASRGYKSKEVTGVDIDPRAIAQEASNIRAKLDAEGFSEVIATKAHNILKMLENMPKDAVAVAGNGLHAIQKTFGKAARSIEPEERAGAVAALRLFNEYIENIPASQVLKGSADDFQRVIKEANANWSASKAAETVDKKTVANKLRAETQNSGMNVANKIRQGMADIALNPKLNRGMTEAEIGTAEKIARGTRTENAIRRVSNITGGGGGLGTLAAAAVGGGATAYGGDGAYGAALPVLGFALRGVANRMTLAKAEKLSEAIRSRAPLAKATQEFEQRVTAFHDAKNSKTASAAAIAARDLSSRMREAGFSVSASDLMKAMQGPAKSAAENEQPVPGRPGE